MKIKARRTQVHGINTLFTRKAGPMKHRLNRRKTRGQSKREAISEHS